jgi:hypothetical protein
MIWGDPLVYLLPYAFDYEKIAGYYENSLKVFEKYPDAPYIDFYKVLFRVALGKTRIFMTLNERYKAGDREWLRSFKDVTLPALIRDYEDLYELHDKYWHEECKTHGWEKLGNAYASATDRLRYTAKEIGRYLDGKIDIIEALEAEQLEGIFTKHLGAARVMSTY